MYGILGKAYNVEIIEIGLTIGAIKIKLRAIGSETPFCTSLFITGIVAHSQTGNKKPANIAVKKPKPHLVGKIFTIKSSETNTCKIEDIKIPNNKNGNACKMMLKNTVLKTEK